MSKPRFGIFAEKPAERLTRLIAEEEANLERAERSLMDGSLTFTLQQVHAGKDDILSIKSRLRALKKKLVYERQEGK